MELHRKTCTPCRGGIPPLSAEEAASYAGEIPEWQLLDNATRLFRAFKLGNYAEALAFVTAISAIAEAEGHHPDLCFGWGYVHVSLYTHKIKGLHENDFILAGKIDRLFAARPDGLS